MNDESLDSQQYWDGFAETDPLWAVLAFPDKSDGRWSLPEFMKTGEREIALLFQRLDELQLPAPTRRGLDFGCGVGRLTQALARRMSRVTGADISRVMIDVARKLNRYPERAEYLCTTETGIDALPAQSLQCIYSNIVLQHVAPDLSRRYLNSFFRLLEPNGVLVFQLPSHKQDQVEAEIQPMPDFAYRASIETGTAIPARVEAGSEMLLTFNVRNASDHEWRQPQVGPLALGNHWLDERGELMVAQDDGRAPLLQIVPPGLAWPVMVKMHAPAVPGRYVGEIDLVHEGVTWFAHKGSPTVRFSIEVTAAGASIIRPPAATMKEYPVPEYTEAAVPRPSATPAAPTKADFPMNGIHREEVMQIIRGHGARLAYLEEDRRAGPEWVSYRYFVVGRS